MEMVSKEWVFIVNPIAGNGFGKEIVPKLGEMIRKHNVDAEIVLTERSGHAAELSEQYYKRGFRYIIGVGGDGTFNEMCRRRCRWWNPGRGWDSLPRPRRSG